MTFKTETTSCGFIWKLAVPWKIERMLCLDRRGSQFTSQLYHFLAERLWMTDHLFSLNLRPLIC